MLIREGSLEFILDGKSEQLGPGGVAYAASGEMHGLKNVGTVPANYFVIAIGPQPKSA
jgi:mannose-6-phosphate isomerase-like protein (cupin superfamily)